MKKSPKQSTEAPKTRSVVNICHTHWQKIDAGPKPYLMDVFLLISASNYTYIGNPRDRGLQGIRRNRRNRGIRWYAESTRIGQNRPKIGQKRSKSVKICQNRPVFRVSFVGRCFYRPASAIQTPSNARNAQIRPISVDFWPILANPHESRRTPYKSRGIITPTKLGVYPYTNVAS